MYRTIVICDHAFTRAGFEHLISSCESFDLQCAAAFTPEVLDTCARDKIDVVIVDLGSLDQPMKTPGRFANPARPCASWRIARKKVSTPPSRLWMQGHPAS